MHPQQNNNNGNGQHQNIKTTSKHGNNQHQRARHAHVQPSASTAAMEQDRPVQKAFHPNHRPNHQQNRPASRTSSNLAAVTKVEQLFSNTAPSTSSASPEKIQIPHLPFPLRYHGKILCQADPNALTREDDQSDDDESQLQINEAASEEGEENHEEVKENEQQVEQDDRDLRPNQAAENAGGDNGDAEDNDFRNKIVEKEESTMEMDEKKEEDEEVPAIPISPIWPDGPNPDQMQLSPEERRRREEQEKERKNSNEKVGPKKPMKMCKELRKIPLGPEPDPRILFPNYCQAAKNLKVDGLPPPKALLEAWKEQREVEKPEKCTGQEKSPSTTADNGGEKSSTQGSTKSSVMNAEKEEEEMLMKTPEGQEEIIMRRNKKSQYWNPRPKTPNPPPPRPINEVWRHSGNNSGHPPLMPPYPPPSLRQLNPATYPNNNTHPGALPQRPLFLRHQDPTNFTPTSWKQWQRPPPNQSGVSQFAQKPPSFGFGSSPQHPGSLSASFGHHSSTDSGIGNSPKLQQSGGPDSSNMTTPSNQSQQQQSVQSTTRNLEELVQENKLLKENNQELKQQLKNQQAEVDRVHSVETSLTNLKEKASLQAQNIIRTKAENAQLNRELKEAKAKNEHLEIFKRAKENGLKHANELKTEIIDLKREKKKAEMDRDLFKSKLDTKNEELNSLGGVLQKQWQNKMQKKEELWKAKMEKEKKELNEKHQKEMEEQMGKTKKEIEKIATDKSELEKTIGKMRMDAKKLEKEKKKSKEDNEKMEEEMEKLREEAKKMTAEKLELEQKNAEERDRLRREMDDLKKQLEEKRSQNGAKEDAAKDELIRDLRIQVNTLQSLLANSTPTQRSSISRASSHHSTEQQQNMQQKGQKRQAEKDGDGTMGSTEKKPKIEHSTTHATTMSVTTASPQSNFVTTATEQDVAGRRTVDSAGSIPPTDPHPLTATPNQKQEIHGHRANMEEGEIDDSKEDDGDIQIIERPPPSATTNSNCRPQSRTRSMAISETSSHNRRTSSVDMEQQLREREKIAQQLNCSVDSPRVDLELQDRNRVLSKKIINDQSAFHANQPASLPLPPPAYNPSIHQQQSIQQHQQSYALPPQHHHSQQTIGNHIGITPNMQGQQQQQFYPPGMGVSPMLNAPFQYPQQFIQPPQMQTNFQSVSMQMPPMPAQQPQQQQQQKTPTNPQKKADRPPRKQQLPRAAPTMTAQPAGVSHHPHSMSNQQQHQNYPPNGQPQFNQNPPMNPSYITAQLQQILPQQQNTNFGMFSQIHPLHQQQQGQISHSNQNMLPAANANPMQQGQRAQRTDAPSTSASHSQNNSGAGASSEGCINGKPAAAACTAPNQSDGPILRMAQTLIVQFTNFFKSHPNPANAERVVDEYLQMIIKNPSIAAIINQVDLEKVRLQLMVLAESMVNAYVNRTFC